MLSRLWYLVLALAVGCALAGAFLNKSAASREAEFQLEEQLRRDRIEAELWMRLDARLRLDALASIAVEPEVRQTLRSSSGRFGTPAAATRRRLSQKLNSLNAKLEEGKGDMVFAVDAEGEVVATLDKNAMESERLDKMPLVRDALRGFMRDDVWVYNGEVFRMAARPVFDGGRYVGAVVHGMAVGDDLARRLGSKLPNASVVFFFRDRLIGAHVGGATAPSRAQLKSGLAVALTGADEEQASVRNRRAHSRDRVAHSWRGGARSGRIHDRPQGKHRGPRWTLREHLQRRRRVACRGSSSSESRSCSCCSALFLLYLEHDKAVGILRKTSRGPREEPARQPSGGGASTALPQDRREPQCGPSCGRRIQGRPGRTRVGRPRPHSQHHARQRGLRVLRFRGGSADCKTGRAGSRTGAQTGCRFATHDADQSGTGRRHRNSQARARRANCTAARHAHRAAQRRGDSSSAARSFIATQTRSVVLARARALFTSSGGGHRSAQRRAFHARTGRPTDSAERDARRLRWV